MRFITAILLLVSSALSAPGDNIGTINDVSNCNGVVVQNLIDDECIPYNSTRSFLPSVAVKCQLYSTYDCSESVIEAQQCQSFEALTDPNNLSVKCNAA
ncbi:hypothetical protein MaudCBS49596_005997 [Microsporum audouinii]